MRRVLPTLLLVAAVALVFWRIGPGRRAADGPHRPDGPVIRPWAGGHDVASHEDGGVVRTVGVAPDGYRFSLDVPGWAASHYGATAPRRPLDRLARETLDALGRRHLRYDTALARAADSLSALHAEADVPLTGALQDFVLRRAGVLAPGVRRYSYFTSRRDEDGFREHLEEVLREEPRPRDALHVGVGHAEGARDPRFRHTYTILVVAPLLHLDPLPRGVEAGETVRVAGRLVAGLGRPRVLDLSDGGEVVERFVIDGGDGSFRADVPTPLGGGELWLEVLAEGDRGPEVAALFPLYVGRPVSDRFRGIVPPEEGALSAPEELAALLFELVNADRARFGVPPLEWDGTLADVATGHALDMRDNDFVAHVSPRSGDVGDRAQAARYVHLQIGENVARDTSVYSAEEALMRSLGHRQNILSRSYTHLGVGVAIEERLSGGPSLSLVQVFATPAQRLDPAHAAEQVRRRIATARHDQGLEPVRRLAALDRVAATAVGTPADPETMVSKAHDLLQRRRPDVGAIRIRAYVLPSLADLPLSEDVLRAEVGWLGVAAAQLPDLEKDPRVRVVVLVGER